MNIVPQKVALEGKKQKILLLCLGSRWGSELRCSLQTSNVNSYDQHTWATPLSVIGLLASPVSSAAGLENVQQAAATHTHTHHTHTHTVLLPLNPHGGKKHLQHCFDSFLNTAV